MSAVLDLLFPPKCAFCGRVDRSGVCPACERALPRTETALREGTLTLLLGGEDVGDYTFARYKDGWSIRNAAGKYLNASIWGVSWSRSPLEWKLQDGVFTATTMAARSGLFQLITLPVEFDASHRALAIIDERGMLTPDEFSGAKKVLSAAALTYVAALLTSLAQLLRLLILFNRRRD